MGSILAAGTPASFPGIRIRSLPAVLLLAGALLLPAPVAAQGTGDNGADPVAALDAIFRDWDSARSPGCAAGVDFQGAPEPLLRSWGMADLEHGVANTPATIFEAGSVSKQFTSAAIVMLHRDGVLSLDDDVRRWIPELHDHGTPVTIRQMMNHTAGLRDWGSVAAIAGWDRTERTHTHDHVLEIAARQRALNYTPGEAYSYSNTGFNLMAIIVERASGVPFAQFSRERIFQPAGLHDTQWRDDYRRIVPRRSSAYRTADGGWAIDRPVEHVHGNGGLLTTVEDLLRWNRVLEAARLGLPQGAVVGGNAFHSLMVEQGVLNDGTVIHYAAGLQVGELDGRPSITHTGSTAGYRAFLGRYPADGVSVALLCNTGNANPGRLGGEIARLFLPAGAAAATDEEESEDTSPATGPAPRVTPTDYAGSYESDEAEVIWRVEAEGGEVVLVRRPGIRTPLRPTDVDTFQAPGGLGTIRFHRDSGGRVVELGVSQARVWDLRFQRLPGGGARGG